eukprot:1146537-Amphidinium_carterae.1
MALVSHTGFVHLLSSSVRFVSYSLRECRPPIQRFCSQRALPLDLWSISRPTAESSNPEAGIFGVLPNVQKVGSRSKKGELGEDASLAVLDAYQPGMPGVY